MNKELDETVQALITFEIEGHAIDYEITSNIHGEVQQVKNLFGDIPVAAQKLILGKDWEVIAPKAEGYRRLFRYFVAAQMLELRKGDDLQPIMDKITQARQKNGLPPRQILLSQLTDIWYVTFAECVQNIRQFYNNGKNAKLESLEYLFLGNPEKLRVAIEYHGSFRTPGVGEMILDWIPVLTDEQRFQAYKSLKIYPQAAAKKLLLAAYEDKNNNRGIENIIIGLSAYKHDDTHRLFLQHAKRTSLSYNEKKAILEALRYSDKEEVLALAWNNLLDKDLGAQACDLIKKRGVEDQEIVDYLITVLAQDNWVEHFQRVLSLFANHLNTSKHQPSPIWLLDYLIRFFELKKYKITSYYDPIVSSFSKICRYYNNQELAIKISRWAQDSSENVHTFVFLFSELMLKKEVLYPLDHDLKPIVKAAITTEVSLQQKYAIILAGRYALSDRSTEFIDDLLPVLASKNIDNSWLAAATINKIMQELGFVDKVRYSYEKRMNSQSNLRLNAILSEGLKLADQ
ncbi:MAG: hypothetical protein ACRBG0_25030 [Lewinella sp.]|jgi:hypothetical protein|uniref:hypothetical protein n=1 Tax=Lewinella sp. TaxID=2004506 RepID=UPI003D6B262B